MKVKKILFIVLGSVSLGLGAIGILLPILPTTPFVILAAICFAMGNSKLAVWLKNSKVFGPFIDNYYNKCGIELRLKVINIIVLWVGLTVSVLVTQRLWLGVMLGAIGVGVTIHILKIKTKKPEDSVSNEPTNPGEKVKGDEV